MAKVKLSAKQILKDLEAGLDEAALMEKYNLSEAGLQKIFDKMSAAGLLNRVGAASKGAQPELPRDRGEPCPACGSPLPEGIDRCPECGFVLSGKEAVKEPGPPPAQAKDLKETEAFHVAEKALAAGKKFAVTGASRAKRIAEDISRLEVVGDLSKMNFTDEILPIDATNMTALMKDFVFWAVALLGVIPLVIATLSHDTSQITAFAVFFAFVWGMIFKRMVIGDRSDWKLPLAAFVFTGMIGMPLLLMLYRVLPAFYLNLSRSTGGFTSLIGYVFQVGFWEELCKILPVLLYVAWKKIRKKQAYPPNVLLLGVFSGLAFAAFENVDYAQLSVLKSLQLQSKYGADGLVVGVKGAMINVMLRSLSLVFCHAVWSGVFAYFVSVAAATGRRWGALFVVGLAVSAVLHGTYDWLCGINLTIAALTAGFSFMLFYAYVSKMHALITPAASEA